MVTKESVNRYTKHNRKTQKMTLKISRFLTDAFNKQAKISHFDYTLEVGRPDKMKLEWKQKLLD